MTGPSEDGGPNVAVGAAAGAGASPCQLNATPANDWNHAVSCGYEVAGTNWRCRCGPVECPVGADEPDGRARGERGSRRDVRLHVGEVAVEVGRAVGDLDREADAAVRRRLGERLHDDPVRERVEGRAHRRGDVGRRVVVVRRRGRDDRGAAADREDELAGVDRRAVPVAERRVAERERVRLALERAFEVVARAAPPRRARSACARASRARPRARRRGAVTSSSSAANSSSVSSGCRRAARRRAPRRRAGARASPASVTSSCAAITRLARILEPLLEIVDLEDGVSADRGRAEAERRCRASRRTRRRPRRPGPARARPGRTSRRGCRRRSRDRDPRARPRPRGSARPSRSRPRDPTGFASPSPSASVPQRSHVDGMNCIHPTAPAELGPMLRPKFDSILLIAPSTSHGTP